MRVTGLQRIVLELARDGVVLEGEESTAVAAAYRGLAQTELLPVDDDPSVMGGARSGSDLSELCRLMPGQISRGGTL